MSEFNPGAEPMKFTRGRRYAYNGSEYKCYGHTPSGAAVLCTDSGASYCTNNPLGFTELPPSENEFLEGEEVEINDGNGLVWTPAIYAGKTSIGSRPHLAMVKGGTVVASWEHCRSPLPKRRVPTDEDAKRRPKCWVRNRERDNWKEAVLIAVVPSAVRPFKFVFDDGNSDGFAFCEVEA